MIDKAQIATIFMPLVTAAGLVLPGPAPAQLSHPTGLGIALDRLRAESSGDATGLRDPALPSTASKQVQFVPNLAAAVQEPEVQQFLRYFQGPGRDQITHWLNRGAPYLDAIREQVRSAGLPPTFAYLPMIESGFSNEAVSSKGAAGLWQLMPATAREYGLRVDRLVDERRDAEKATDAAIRHLRDLAQRFDSPSLVAAAYNAGAGRIARSLEAADADSFDQLLESSLLPSETAAFVPRLIAAAKIADDPERYGIEIPTIARIDCDSVVVSGSVRIADIARAANLPVATVRSLNPQYIQGKTPPGSRSVIRLPKGKANSLAGKMLASLTSKARTASEPSPTRHVRVRRGDTVESIAERYQVAEGRLRWVNALPEWYRLRPGQILRLPDS